MRGACPPCVLFIKLCLGCLMFGSDSSSCSHGFDCCPVLYAPFDKCFRVRERERFWPKSRKRRATKSEFTTMLRAMSKMATQQNGIIDRGDLHPTYHPPTTRQSSGDLVSLLQANNQPHATINHASSLSYI